jgi:hypothetical protein
MPKYSATSAYATTPLNDYYLDVMTNRPIPRESDDIVFTINATYSNRPDLLAYDLYEHADLWWVFAQRNPNVLVNPLNDFKTGTVIFLPKISTLRSVLGF